MMFKSLYAAGFLLLAALVKGSPIDSVTSSNKTCETVEVSISIDYAFLTDKKTNETHRIPFHLDFPLTLHRLCSSTQTVDFSRPVQKVIVCQGAEAKNGWVASDFHKKHPGDHFTAEMPMLAPGHSGNVSLGNVIDISEEELNKAGCVVATMKVESPITKDDAPKVPVKPHNTCEMVKVNIALSYVIVTIDNEKPHHKPANISYPMTLHRLCNSTRTIDFSHPVQKVVLCGMTEEDNHSNEFIKKHGGDHFMVEIPSLAPGRIASASISNAVKVADEELDKNHCFAVTMTVESPLTKNVPESLN